jgi:hypothetical protein
MKLAWLFKKRNLVVVAVIAVVLLTLDFSNRMSDTIRLSGERDVLRTEVAELTVTVVHLETKLAYATSDQAVRDWARLNGMAQEGDVPVVPEPAAGPTPAPVELPVPTPQPVTNLDVWLALFFGD